LLDVKKPAEVDPHGTEYTFEKSTLKLGGAGGYADVWKKGCFAWEYKGPKKNLVQAYAQLKGYADALDNPPLLIVSDMREIRIHTNFTNTIAQQHVFGLSDIVAPETRNTLRACFVAPERLRPTETREGVTAKAATRFASIAVRLRHQHHDPQRIAHFLNKLVFCLFVEDIDLLPKRVFADIVDEAVKGPRRLPIDAGRVVSRHGQAKRPVRRGHHPVVQRRIVRRRRRAAGQPARNPRSRRRGAARLERDRSDDHRDAVRERARRQETKEPRSEFPLCPSKPARILESAVF
jgi:hypothetical protein